MPANRSANSLRGWIEAGVEHHDGGRRDREQHRAHIAQASPISGRGHRPRNRRDRAPARAAPRAFQIGARPRAPAKPASLAANSTNGAGQRLMSTVSAVSTKASGRTSGGCGASAISRVGALQANPLHGQHVVDRGDDGRERARDGDQPVSPLDGRIKNDELGERALERRQAHDRKYAETEQRGRERHARAAARQIVQVRGARAADEMPAGQEHEAAHRRLIAEMHIGPGIARGPAQSKPDEDVANLGNRREHERPYEIGQA